MADSFRQIALIDIIRTDSDFHQIMHQLFHNGNAVIYTSQNPPVSKGLEIIEGLRGHTSGYAVPTFVVDAPGGGGKIAIQPNYLI